MVGFHFTFALVCPHSRFSLVVRCSRFVVVVHHKRFSSVVHRKRFSSVRHCRKCFADRRWPAPWTLCSHSWLGFRPPSDRVWTLNNWVENSESTDIFWREFLFTSSMWEELSSLGTMGLGEGGKEVSEEKTPKMSIPSATSHRARAMPRTVTSIREGRLWGRGKGGRCSGLWGFPMPLMRKGASIGGESGGNKYGVWSVDWWWSAPLVLVDPLDGGCSETHQRRVKAGLLLFTWYCRAVWCWLYFIFGIQDGDLWEQAPLPASESSVAGLPPQMKTSPSILMI